MVLVVESNRERISGWAGVECQQQGNQETERCPLPSPLPSSVQSPSLKWCHPPIFPTLINPSKTSSCNHADSHSGVSWGGQEQSLKCRHPSWAWYTLWAQHLESAGRRIVLSCRASLRPVWAAQDHTNKIETKENSNHTNS